MRDTGNNCWSYGLEQAMGDGIAEGVGGGGGGRA